MQYIWNDIRSPHSNNNSSCSSDESSDSDENTFTINEVQNQPNTRKKQRSFNANLKIGKSTIPFQINSGLFVNIIDETTSQRIKKNNPNIVNSASKIFQHTIQGVFNGIPGCRNISDDIIVFRKTQNEHDKTLEMILQEAEQRNLKFNFAKCQFDQTQLELFGYIFSADGISPSANKVQAIKDASVPKNASEVRSFLGMVQYCGRFIPNWLISLLYFALSLIKMHN